jgi:hypothetical protein
MEEYVPQNINDVSVNLGARFAALQSFQELTVKPPCYLSWMFVFMTQVVYEEVAIKYPDACGFSGKSEHAIHSAVNKDLRRLCSLALGKDPSRDALKGYKVILSTNYLLTY